MFSSLLKLFQAVWRQLFKLLGFGESGAALPPPPDQPEMLSIFVRTNLGEKVHVELAPDWTVAKVKEQLVPQLKTSSRNLRIIFAGKELPDSLVVGECDLGQNSVLHAVRVVAVAGEVVLEEARVTGAAAVVTAVGADAAVTLKIVGDETPATTGLEEPGDEPTASTDTTVAVHRPENTVDDDCGAAAAAATTTPDTPLGAEVSPAAVAAGDAAPPVPAGGAPACHRLLCDASTVMTIQLTQYEQDQIRQLKEASDVGGGERPHFYVYCVRPCAGVRVGKLRVRCAQCKQGAVTLLADPASWPDVLNPRRMLCSCASPECSELSPSESYAEFYFKCSSHVTAGDDDVAVPLYLIRANLPGVRCLSCTDVATPVVVFECEASHVMCVDCFITYCLSKLNERQFTHDLELGYTLPCPVNCDDSLIREVHHFRLMGEEQYNRYQHWATEEAVLAAGGVLCPRPGCGHGILPDEDCVRIVCEGGGCGFVFCRHCLREYHTGQCWRPGDSAPPAQFSSGASSYSVSSTTEGGRWDVASASAIHSLTKPCPKCRTPTERSGGCMHMVCTRASCRHNWCWVCHTDWTRDCMASHWFG